MSSFQTEARNNPNFLRQVSFISPKNIIFKEIRLILSLGRIISFSANLPFKFAKKTMIKSPTEIYNWDSIVPIRQVFKH